LPALSYVAGFENSPKIRPRHYELWLASPGRPVPVGSPTSGGGIATAPPPVEPKTSEVPSAPRPTIPTPVIDSVTASASQETNAYQSGGLSLRIFGQWLDPDAEIRVDDVPFVRSRVDVRVLKRSSNPKLATDVNVTLKGFVIDPAPRHTVTLISGNGVSVRAPFQFGHTVSAPRP